MYVRFIAADGRNCCDNIFIAVHRCSSIFHPQTFGLFACFYYHKAGMNILKHMCRSISMPQSGVAGLGVHTSSTSTDSKLCPKWLQQLACLPANSWLIWKDPDAGKNWAQEEKGMTEDEMVGCHHWLNGHGFGWTLGVGDGQGGLACCSSWGGQESDMTE